MQNKADFLDIIYTTRAIRKFTQQSVPNESIRKILEAATQAPSGGNRQPWRFLVIRDQDQKEKIGAAYLKGALEYQQKTLQQFKEEQEHNSNSYLSLHFSESPVVIVVCAEYRPLVGDKLGILSQPSSIYPAVQNLLLAANYMGLGGVLTTNHRYHAAEIKTSLGIPDSWVILTMIPLGYPAEKHGKKSRQPVEDVSFSDFWDQEAEF